MPTLAEKIALAAAAAKRRRTAADEALREAGTAKGRARAKERAKAAKRPRVGAALRTAHRLAPSTTGASVVDNVERSKALATHRGRVPKEHAKTCEDAEAARERRAAIQRARAYHLTLPPELAATLTPYEAAMFRTDPPPTLLAHVQRKHPRDLAAQMACLLSLAADIPAPGYETPRELLEMAEALQGKPATRGELVGHMGPSEDDEDAL